MNLKFLKSVFRYNKDLEIIDYDFYKGIEIFHNLTNNEILKINDMIIHKTYKKDEVIFHENHPHVVLYIIKSGMVKLFLKHHEEDITITDLGAKKHFGEIGLFIEMNRMSSAIATEDTVLLVIKKSDFRQFVKSYPATGIKLLVNLGKAISNDLVHSYSLIRKNETKQ